MHVFVDRTFTGGRSNGLVQKQAVDAHPDGIIYDEPCSLVYSISVVEEICKMLRVNRYGLE